MDYVTQFPLRIVDAIESNTVQRRLAAILAADVVGYSRLMGMDEVGTLSRLKAHRRDLVDPAVAAHHGRIVKTTGDGALVEFSSAVDAVACAVAIQRGMVSRNASIPEDKRIVFRIGINMGDIIIDGDDIFGDGVNIAARLEALCEPGGVWIPRKTSSRPRKINGLSARNGGFSRCPIVGHRGQGASRVDCQKKGVIAAP